MNWLDRLTLRFQRLVDGESARLVPSEAVRPALRIPVWRKVLNLLLGLSTALQLLAFCVLLVIAMLVWIDARPTSGELEDLKAQGHAITLQVEQYKLTAGHYPALRDVQLPDAPYGGWQDALTSDGSDSLRLGGYSEDGFVLSWLAERRRWYVDR